MATTSEIQVTEAYIGLLGRAPDPAGLAYWTNQLDKAVAAGQDATLALKKLTNDIALSPEFSTGIGANVPASGNPSQAQADAIVTSLYQNLFERAPTQADLDYWTPQLTGGSTTAPEMTLNLITAAKSNTAKPTDGQILGFKQEAATYYVENVPQDKYSASSATNAVKDVDGPTSLQASKDATDYVKTGVGITTDLATIGAGNDVPMTATQDVVTGTVGTGATYTTQNVKDVTTGDNDIMTLTGDDGFVFDDVTNVENINVNLSDALGAGFTINAAKALSSTINVDVAETVVQGGVTLTGETALTVSNLSTSNLSTSDVTKLTADPNGGAVTITGDNDLAVVDLNDLDANDTTLILNAASVDVDLDGDGTVADTGNDTINIQAKGAVAVDLTDGAQLVEKLGFAGNGAAVTYTITNATAASQTYTVSGDQDVTLAGTTAMFGGAKFSDTSTAGSTALKVTTDGVNDSMDVSTWGVLSGGIEIASGMKTGVTNTMMVASGSTVKISADQAATADLVFDTNDGTTSSSLTLDIDNDSAALIQTVDVDTLTIQTGDMALSLEQLDASDNDATVSIGGTNDITFTGAVAAGDLTVTGNDTNFTSIDADGDLTVTATTNFVATGAIAADNDVSISADDIDSQAGLSTATSGASDGNVSLTSTGNDVDLAGATDVDGTLTVTAADAFTQNNTALNAENDITITADDFTAGDAVTVQAGKFTATVTNDISVTGDLSVTGGGVTIVQNGTSDNTVSFGGGDGSLTVSNDISITAENVDIDGVVTTAGNLTIAAENDVTVAAAAATDVSGNITISSSDTAGASVITTTGTLKADNDITITAGDQIKVDELETVKGNVTLTATNEITLDNTASTDISGTLTVKSTSATAGAGNGLILVDVAVTADNDIAMTGAQITLGGAVTSSKDDVTLTATNDIATNDSIVATEGSVTVSVTGANTMDFAMAAAADKLTAANDVTVSADDVTVGEIESTAAGNVTITANNDVVTLGDITTNTGSGSVSITSNQAWVDGDAGITLANGSTIDADNDITITAASGAEINLDNAILLSSAIGDIKITGGDIDGSGNITATKGDIQLNSTNDSETSTLSGTITADQGSITTLGGKFAISDLDADAGGITIAGDSQGSFGALQTTGSSVRITASNSTQGATGDVSITSIDSPTVLAQGPGDYALGTVTSSNTAAVTITSGAGNDSATLNAAGDVYTVSTGDGADSITNTASAATSTINLGGGDDTYTPTATAANATVDMGAGTGDKLVVNGNHSADGVITNYEILQIGGDTTLSEAQIDNDATFEVQGGNHTITIGSASTIDLSAVSFEAGNTTKFAINSGNSGSTITGSDANDVLTGGNGVDNLSGGEGTDTINGGAGIDSLTGGGDADTFILAETVANRDTINDYVEDVDFLQFEAAATTVATAAGNLPVLNTNTVAAGVGGGAYAATGAATNATDVVILSTSALTTGTNGGDLSAATDGTELLKALTNGAAADTYTGLTTTAESDEFYAVAYQNGNAYIYYVQEGAGTKLAVAADIKLVATLTGVAVNALDQADFAVLL